MSDLAQLSADLHRAADSIIAETKKVSSKGGLNVKNDWRKAITGRQMTPGLARTITYDVKASGGVVSTEIGPSPVPGDSVASLGGVIEEGTVNNAPFPAGAIALEAEAPRFEDALGALGKRLLDG